ncbi:helix-turn-helix domain-containing protein, partial [Myxococcota bacterium]|nr:helix-turn-helix domain-containing protein [Myxococcota bacterium]
MDLRTERERRGLSLAQVAASCRIPQRYLEALESGRREDLPKGPFLDAYQRQYLAYLGLPADAELAPPPAAPSRPAPVGPAATRPP